MGDDRSLRRAVPVALGDAGVHALEISVIAGLEKPFDLPGCPAEHLRDGNHHTIAIGGLAPPTQPNQNKVLFYH